MRERGGLALLLCGLLWSTVAVAAEPLQIAPTLVTGSATVEEAIKKSGGYARTTIEGEGRTLDITYTASDTITVFIVPLSADDVFNPADYMVFPLTAGEERRVHIDLAVSPGWRPGPRTYLLNLLAPSAETEVAMQQASFVEEGLQSLPVIALKHLGVVEPFSPSSYHALRGYRILSISVTVVCGIFLIALCTLVALRYKGRARSDRLLVILAWAILLYGARFGIDQLRITTEHLSSMLSTGMYDEAESIYQVSSFLKTTQEEGAVFVCRTGTNFQEKILRYFLYPTRVSADPATAETASYALVSGSIRNPYDNGVLRCHDEVLQATYITAFPDGSTLYSLTHEQ